MTTGGLSRTGRQIVAPSRHDPSTEDPRSQQAREAMRQARASRYHAVERLMEEGSRVRPKYDPKRDKRGDMYEPIFRVRWKGYGRADDTWEPITHVDKRLVTAFREGQVCRALRGSADHPHVHTYPFYRARAAYTPACTKARGGASRCMRAGTHECTHACGHARQLTLLLFYSVRACAATATHPFLAPC